MNSRQHINSWYVPVLLVIGIYLIGNFVFPEVGNSLVNLYVIQPLLWIGLLVVTMQFLTPYRPAPERINKNFIVLAIIGGLLQVILYFIVGIFLGFGQSPYTFTFIGITRNLFMVSTMLLGIEFTRAWLVKRWGKHNNWLAVTTIGIFFTLISVPFKTLVGLQPDTLSIEYINRTFLPLLMENLLASQMALYSGPAISLVYRGILQAFWWFSPVLPDIKWTFMGLIGTALPVMLMVAATVLRNSLLRKLRSREKTSSLTSAVWLGTALLGVILIWFAVGLFPVKPTLIASGSMRPSLEVGDIVLVSKVDPQFIRIGDVIQFYKSKNEDIVHRVISIKGVGDKKVFVTQGDANDTPDVDPVYPGAIIGKNIFTIPKLGWLAVLVKNYYQN